MPTKKPRITITLTHRQHEVLWRLSQASGDSMSEIVAGFVDMAVPSLERVVSIMERAKAAPAEVKSGFARVIDLAEAQALPALERVLGQADMFLTRAEAAVAETETTAATRGSGAAASSPAPAAAVKAVPGRVRTPVPVTRGSGRAETARKGARRG